jgi:hypothetical protein
VGAAAGLQVDALHFHQAHAARSARGLHAHAAHQAGLASNSASVIQRVAHRMGGSHQAGDAGGERVLVERLGHVEVQPGVAGGDAAAVHRVRHQGAQQVRGGVEAAVRLAPVGIDGGHHRLAGGPARQVGARRHQVQDLPRLGALAGVDDDQARAVGALQPAGVTRLAATLRVEHRAVQLMPASPMAVMVALHCSSVASSRKSSSVMRWSV